MPFNTSAPHASYVTTPSVYVEASHARNVRGALGALTATGKLSIIKPQHGSLQAARRAARKTGDMPNLSEQDVSLIALCMERQMRLVSDDYAILNVMHSLNLKTLPVMTGGIRDELHWQYYCPGCRLVCSRSGAASSVMGGARSGSKYIHKKGGQNPRRALGQKRGKTVIECQRCGNAMRRRPVRKRRANA